MDPISQEKHERSKRHSAISSVAHNEGAEKTVLTLGLASPDNVGGNLTPVLEEQYLSRQPVTTKNESSI